MFECAQLPRGFTLFSNFTALNIFYMLKQTNRQCKIETLFNANKFVYARNCHKRTYRHVKQAYFIS